MEIDRNLGVVVGLAVAYLFATAGLIFAWRSYNKRKKEAGKRDTAR